MNNKLLKGTLILTITGIITKLLGFYYRIFLSNVIGATGMGIYQMCLPILGLFAALSTSGIELSISKRISEVSSNKTLKNKRLVSGIIYGQIMSLFSCLVFLPLIPIISSYLIKDMNISSLLYTLIPAIPLMSLHSTLNGYFLGDGKPHITGISICIENLSKLVFMIVLSNIFATNAYLTPNHCILAITFSEIASCIYMLIVSYLHHTINLKGFFSNIKAEFSIYFRMAIPLSFTRILLSLMHSVEAVLIPTLLMSYGLSTENSLGIYGILVGMSLPFILFPTAISNALSNVLLPSISSFLSKNNPKKLRETASTALKFSLSMGVFFTGFFIVYGNDFGILFFDNELAGNYIKIFAWLCPFIYVDISLSSIINGFGLTKVTFKNNTIAAVARTLLLLVLVKNLGITGYLWGLLIGELVSMLLNLFSVRKLITIDYNVIDYLIMPLLYTFISIGIGIFCSSTISTLLTRNRLIVLLFGSITSGMVYMIFAYGYFNKKKK